MKTGHFHPVSQRHRYHGVVSFRHSALVPSLLMVFWIAPTLSGVVVEFKATGTDVVAQGTNTIEDPAPGSQIEGCTVQEWRDADYRPGSLRPHEEWIASGNVEGSNSQVWLRGQGDSITTGTSAASTAISIHLEGDANDGRGRVLVDGTEVAILDMWSSPTERILVVVKGLPYRSHTVIVEGLGASQQAGAPASADDVAVWGAAALDCGCAFVAESTGGEISHVDLTSGNVTRVASGLDFPVGVVRGSQARVLYVTEGTGGELSTVDLDSGAVTTLVSGLTSFPGFLALDSAETAALVTRGSELVRVDLGTGNVTGIAAGLAQPTGVVLDPAETSALVAEFGSGELSRVELATGAITLVASGLSGPTGIARDAAATTAYVAERTSGELSSVDLASGNVTLVAAGLTDPLGVALDATGTTALVAELTTGRLVEIDLASGNVTTAATGLTDPQGVSVGCPPPAAGLQKPFDMNQDGRLDISDSIAYFDHLFQGITPRFARLPCEGGTSANPGPGELILLDSNGDGRLDISDGIHALNFFFGGCLNPPCPPPSACRGNRNCPCLIIPGCPDNPIRQCARVVEERCTDGFDDDGDGLTDCDDPDCATHRDCPVTGESNCGDGVDNDGDGLTDCADPDCCPAGNCGSIAECGTLIQGVECVLFQTDSGKRYVGDFRPFQVGDRVFVAGCIPPSCTSFCMQGDGCIQNLTIQSCPVEDNCGDGVDNDGDGLTDCEDPDCAGSSACDCPEGFVTGTPGENPAQGKIEFTWEPILFRAPQGFDFGPLPTPPPPGGCLVFVDSPSPPSNPTVVEFPADLCPKGLPREIGISVESRGTLAVTVEAIDPQGNVTQTETVPPGVGVSFGLASTAGVASVTLYVDSPTMPANFCIMQVRWFR